MVWCCSSMAAALEVAVLLSAELCALLGPELLMCAMLEVGAKEERGPPNEDREARSDIVLSLAASHQPGMHKHSILMHGTITIKQK